MIVAAVLVSLAAPSVQNLMDKSRLRSATDDIVSLLNRARGSAVKLQRDVNVSVKTSPWCVGAVAAADPAVGDPVLTAAACDCAATTVECLVDTQPLLLSSSSYTYGSGGVTLTSGSGGNQLLNTNGGITFNSKFGALGLGTTLPTSVKVTSPLGKFSTQITVSPLGVTYVCVPAPSPFVSGYPSC